MKKMSTREIRLISLTALVLVGVMTFVMVRRQLEANRSRNNRMEDALSQLTLQEEALKMRPDLLTELQRIRGQLPRHPVDKDLNTRFLRQVQNLAGSAGLTLTDRTPEDEVYLESLDVYTTSIRCGWRGSSEALVGFLVRMQQLGPVMDVHTLRLRTESRNRKSMSGSFTLEFVYSREEGVETLSETPREIAL